MIGLKTIAGISSFHFCKPGRTWYAWNYSCGPSRYYAWQDPWWSRTEDSLLWVLQDNATGDYTWNWVIEFHLRSAFTWNRASHGNCFNVSSCYYTFQGFAYLPAGICVSSMGRPVSYEQAVAWKVLNDDDSNHCLAFMFMNWSFV